MEIEREQGEILVASPGRELAGVLESQLAPDEHIPFGEV